MTVSKWYAPLLILLTLGSAVVFADGLPSPKDRVWERGTAYGPQGYLEHLPAGYGAAPAPLIIFLSGRGQGGPGTAQSLDNLGNIGLAEEIKRGRWPGDRPFVVLSPQHNTQKDCPSADEIDDFIQFAKANYKVNTDKIYLTGMSCGARGVADYLAKYGGKDVAAAAPMSGDLTPALKQGCRLVQDVALFGVHGGQDHTIEIGPDRAAFQKLASCPDRRDVEWVEYAEAGHAEPFIWMYAKTADYDVYSWMLQFSKRRSPTLGATASRVESAR